MAISKEEISVKRGNSTVKAYDSFFRSEEGESAYQRRYGRKVLPRDMWVLNAAALEALEAKYPKYKEKPATNVSRFSSKDEQRTFRVIDYGAGHGRSYHFMEQLAAQLKPYNINLEVVIYDPSQEGLKSYKKHLEESGFAVTKDASIHENDTDQGYEGPILQKDNSIFRFIHSSIFDSNEHAKSLICSGGDIDLYMSMFGVHSYGQGADTRHEMFKLASEVTASHGRCVFTVPGNGRFPELQAKYDKLRSDGTPHRNATEAGDVYYTRPGVDGEIYYHLFDAGEFKQVLENAGLKPEGGIQIDDITDMKFLLENPILSKVDEWLSWGLSKVLPSTYLTSVCTDLLAVCKPDKAIHL